MTAMILDGKKLAEQMQAELKTEVEEFVRQRGVRPGLAAVLVGDDPGSQVYVRNKCNACAKAGIQSWKKELPGTATQAELLALVGQLNQDPAVHGILVQLPLPKQIDPRTVLDTINPLKDVDALGAINVGLLTCGTPRYLPCTPSGIHQLLLANRIALAGKHAVIIGRSNIVGKPLALLFLRDTPDSNATVTVCHTKTGPEQLKALARQADLLVVAAGRVPRLVKPDLVKPGAVVVDVGMHRLPDGKLAGDVDFDAVREVASAISPVPGGVGPMTITMLLKNTVAAARLQQPVSPRASGER
ncbi:bifunctional 5,10-methylene-tetrahydrofolate dehydrogenase/5,10-methylene-tetrahydrofolate cyclohydrolase [Planctomycetaceae bacterium SCGC AG-212-F19]|nr:bifunctional 5,10-methylene-tetrahydrofolate dehydrogenase/5,10-methylene-tetrahydrofolate cyclohydrolase [Planctomycetaceae bacterium SCGC AG-212-F19]